MFRQVPFACFVALVMAACLPSRAAEAPPYDVRFADVPRRGLLKQLRQQSETYQLREHAPPTDGLLLWRARQDLPALRDVLRAYGYYGARPTAELETSMPRRVVFRLNPGPRYRLGRVELLSSDASLIPPQRELGWVPGMPALAEPLLEAERAWLERARSRGYPFATYRRREYIPDHDQRLLHVRLELDPGPRAVWGETKIIGLSRVREDFVRGELGFEPGQPFNPAQLDETRARLIRLGLFSSVSLLHADRVEEDGRLDLTLNLRERRPRTIAAGLRYTADEGAGARVEWEHRNLDGSGERIKLTGDLGERMTAVESRFVVPQFLSLRQKLLLSARAAEEETDAYESRNARASAQVEREWRQIVWARTGVAFRFSDVGQFDEEENFVFASIPSSIDWNTSRNILDPRSGFRVFAGAEPFFDLERKNRGFLKSQGAIHRYQRLTRERAWVLAARATGGSILGEPTARVPADERFYAGGGGSVRGYAYQSLGPLRDGEPVGGRSLLELSGEIRGQFSELFGAAIFLDGGTAYESPVPDFDEAFRWGAGFGVRYFTPVGPLRADLAFPLDRREGIDKPFQFYLSLGQSF